MITYDAEHVVWLHRLGREPEELCRGRNAASARQKAKTRAQERGVSWAFAGPTAAPPSAPPSDYVRVPTEVLDQSIPRLRRALDTGDYDQHLKALEAAEEAGKTRTGAIGAILARAEAIG